MFNLKISSFEDLAIDIGTSNTLICAPEGILLNEPSVIAVKQDSSGRWELLSAGHEAKLMIGKGPERIQALRPIRDGVIADYDAAELMIKHYVKTVRQDRFISKPRILIAVPCHMTQVEARAFKMVIESAGVSEIHFIKRAIATAIGAGLQVSEPSGSIIVDIGGGVTEIAVISMGGIVCSKIVPVAGSRFDADIIHYIKRSHGLLIGDSWGEEMKIATGSGVTGIWEIKGMDLNTGLPGIREVSLEEVRKAIMPSIGTISDAIQEVLEQCPPELASDILAQGIVLSGGCALIKDVSQFLVKTLGLPVLTLEEPLLAVARGAGSELKNISSYQRLASDNQKS